MRETEALDLVKNYRTDLKRMIYAPSVAKALASCKGDFSKDLQDPELHGGVNFGTTQIALTGLEFIAQISGQEVSKFMENYFPPEYRLDYHLLWYIFRHGHVHMFIPKSAITGGVTVTGQDFWLGNPPREIADWMRTPESRAQYLELLRKQFGGVHLDLVPAEVYKDSYYRVCAQILYFDILKAIDAWDTERQTEKGVARGFEQGRKNFSAASSRFETPDQEENVLQVLRAKRAFDRIGVVEAGVARHDQPTGTSGAGRFSP